MMKSYKAVCLAIAVLALAVAGAAGAADAPAAPAAADAPAAKTKPLDVGDKMVDFRMKSLEGQEVSFSKNIDGKHKVVVFTFMNTTCASCLSEMDAISNITLKYGDKVGFYAIAVDMRGADTVGPYSKKYNFKANYLLDPEFFLAPKFGLTYTPSTVLIDKEGVIQFKKGGHKPGDLELIADQIVGLVKK